MNWQQQQQNKKESNGGGGGRAGGGGGPAPFLMKTHQMVEEKETNDVISWGEKGNSFVVWKPVEFARDLLPVHFKHNNFSSFVRQLNTYGFRKVVPDRWEFANDNFRRGEQSLLCEIRRRKAFPNPSSASKSTTTTTTKNNKNNNNNNNTPTPSSASTSSTTSSPPPPPSLPPPPPPPQQFLALSNENEKLKKDNQILNMELSHAKKQCQQLLSFLSKYVSMKDINANLLIKEAAVAGVGNDLAEEKANVIEDDDDEKEDNEQGKNVASLKLFGVLLKGIEGEKNGASGTRKRGRYEEGSSHGRAAKVCYGAGPWMGLNSPVRESNKVCN